MDRRVSLPTIFVYFPHTQSHVHTDFAHTQSYVHTGRAAASGFSPNAVARHPVISHLYKIVYVYFAANSRALGHTEMHNY